MTKYKLTFDSDFDNVLKDIKSAKYIKADNESDIIRRAVALYSYLHNQVSIDKDKKVAIIGKDNQVLKIIHPLP